MRKLQVSLFFVFIILSEVFFIFPVYNMINYLLSGSSPILFSILASFLLILVSHYSFKFIFTKYEDPHIRKKLAFLIFLPTIAAISSLTYLFDPRLLIPSLLYYLYLCSRGLGVPKFRVKYYDFKGLFIKRTFLIFASWAAAFLINSGEWYLNFSTPYTLIFFCSSLTLLMQYQIMVNYEEDANFFSQKKNKELFGMLSYLGTAIFALIVFCGYQKIFSALSWIFSNIKALTFFVLNYLIVYLIGPIINALFSALIYLVGLIGREGEEDMFRNFQNIFADDLHSRLEPGTENILPHLNLFLTASCIIAGGLFLWKCVDYFSRGKYFKTDHDPVQETREYVPVNVLSGMKNTFNNLFRKRKPTPPENLVRRTFFEILKKVKTSSISDPPAEIINKYTREIDPGNQEQLLSFSPVYYDVRYGNKPLQKKDIPAIKKLLAKMRSSR